MESIPNSRPYQAAVYIFFNATHGSFCGGSLINPMTILTAAHCVDNTSLNLTIVLGAHSLPSNPANTTHISTGDIVLHPNWTRSTLMNDIAIVRLPSPVELSDRINTVLLPRDDSHDYLGNTTLVSGWGRPADTVGTISPVLREVSSFVISQHACNLAYLGMIDPSHICISGAYGRGTCNGDSGGPLVVNGVQIGVVSFGITYGCEVGWPPVFARVTSYLDWIAQNSANVTAYY
ncbi:chymotrypsin BII-like isoform X2 [Cylas formicarius]|nr:chymotrypsin BII-like isoform X2 [Cylas formicarius]